VPKVSGMTVAELFAEAQRLHRAGRVADAEALYHRILAIDADQADALHYLGVLDMQQDRLDMAEAHIRRSLALKPREPAAHVNLGLLLQRRQQNAEAISSFKAALAIDPFRATALVGLADMHRALGNLNEAILAARKAAAIEPRNADVCALLGIALQDAGQSQAALEWLEKARALRPDDARVNYNLGAALQSLRQSDAAVEAYQRALALDPRLAEAHNNLGILFTERENPTGAVSHLAVAVELSPSLAAVRNNLGKALVQLGRFDDAIACFQQALALDPHFAEARGNIGAAERSLGRCPAAEVSIRQALAEKPDLAEAHANLGLVLRDMGRLDEALVSVDHALELRPDIAEMHANRALVLNDYGLSEAALESCRRAAALKPGSPSIQRSLLGLLIYCSVPAAQQFAAHRRFGQLAVPVKPLEPLHGQRDPGRRLRVGYISSDFRNHPVTRNMLPVLTHRDRTATEVFLYADVTVPTAMTEEVRAAADHWRSIVGLNNLQAASLIRNDAIDILVVLAGRFDQNRPEIAALRVAPIQVSFHDPGTSGIADMDYLLADRTLVPRDSTERFSERVIRLPSFYIHGPIEGPEVGPLPMESVGAVTFGVINNPVKLSDASLRLFGQVLAAIPQSRLYFKFRDRYASRGLRDRVLGLLAEEGIDAARVEVVQHDTHADHLETYHGIDIALDTMPFTGSTTTFESLWMGVPVVTLCGETMGGRWSASMLRVLKLPELVAHSPADYVAAAVRLAGDTAGLATLRRGLRARLLNSPLCNGAGRARQIDRIYRALWRRWCAARGQGS
jgi:protein O-GlcNAc transferase